MCNPFIQLKFFPKHGICRSLLRHLTSMDAWTSLVTECLAKKSSGIHNYEKVLWS